MADTRKGGRLYYKAFNFDLVIAELKQHYPGHHTKAYKDIQIFMRNNGFEHRQGSGYRSNTRLTNTDMLDVVEKLYEAFPWFGQCVSKFDVTNVGEVYDLAQMYRDRAAVETDIAPAPKSVLTQLEEAKAKVQKENGHPQEKEKDRER